MSVSDMPMSKKLEYEEFMNNRSSHVEYDSKIYTCGIQSQGSLSFINKTTKNVKEPLL
jgi:hypothetical protein